MDKIIIKDLLVRGIIGVNDWERPHPQDILVNIELFADLRKAGSTDDINDCVNYHTVATKVVSLVESARRFTIEALAADIARLCLNEPGVDKVLVRVEKPHALWLAKSAEVEILRTRQDFESPPQGGESTPKPG